MSVRVRFAPSPTGWLHVGGARTAYFNWLFARQNAGALVLRIEDTDVVRSTATSEAGVLGDLAWLGLDWDEGPDCGGTFGPYRQSERLGLYRERADHLVERSLAYPCYCTDAELEVRRAAALAAGRPPHYDGRCRTLSAAERAAFIAEGRAASVRYAVPPRDWDLEDRVRGRVRFPAGMVGDFVLLRSNGLPTYNFACAVDDAAMQITHVIRAEEHLANTPRQLMLYDAFGQEPPQFAHAPLILNRDRTKMSKRDGEAAVAVGDYRRSGYLPQALLSYLVLLGFHPGDDREILSRAELLEAFTLDRIGSSGSVFDPDKLRWVNAHYLHHASGAELKGWIERELDAHDDMQPPMWAEAYQQLIGSIAPQMIERALEIVRGNLTTLDDAPRELGYLLAPIDPDAFDPDAQQALASNGAAEVCSAFAEALAALAQWRADAIKSALQQVGADLGVKGKSLFQPVRAALTGRTHGPELPVLAEFIDRDRCIERLRRAEGWSHNHARSAQ